MTIAVRRPGEAPFLIGTVHERMRSAGHQCWALRLVVSGIERACIDYAVVDPIADQRFDMQTWRGPRAGGEAARNPVPVSEPVVIQSSEIGTRHPVRTWTPPDPRALLICADGEGLAAWATVIAAAGEPVAVVGIESAGLSYRFGDDNRDYDASADPRARAYLSDVDPPYFDLHRDYVLDAVIPWAEAQFGRLPRLAFGVSNGAAWAAAMGAIHPAVFDGVLAFSLGMAPSRPPRRGSAVPHALVAGQLEPGCHETTSRYAWRLRARDIPVRLHRPVRGHDLSMWRDELVPALRWVQLR